MYTVNANVHMKVVMDDEALYEMFCDGLQDLIDSFCVPQLSKVETKACDAGECFDKSCPMRSPWTIN